MTMDGVRIIGLTGGIGAGKSTVGRMLRQLGAVVVDADELARRVVQPGSDTIHAVAEAFGSEVLASDHSLDRARLASRVFSNEQDRRRLESILHPAIDRAFRAEVARARAMGVDTIVYEAALLVETGRHRELDLLLVVVADDAVRIARTRARDGLDEQAARERLAAQLPQHRKAELAQFVIDNSGTLADTQMQVNSVWKSICGMTP